MAVLRFAGNQVAFFDGINSSGGNSTFTGVDAPFLSSDVIEIVVPDTYIQPDGSFNFDEVQFTSVTVVRDGVRHSLDVNSGSKIKETGGSEVAEAGDTFFTTNDQVGPASSGPFSSLQSGKMVFSTDSTFVTGQNTTIDRTQTQDLNDDGDTADSGESASGQFNATPANAPACYAHGTLIDTPDGLCAVEALRPGDLVLTLDHGPMPVIWTMTAQQDLSDVCITARPVRVQAGALGHGLPRRDLIVSPQHRLLVGGRGQLPVVFVQEVLVAAKFLTGRPRIRHMTARRKITWHHFVLERHAIVHANGCWAESMLLGPMVLRDLPLPDRKALEARFMGASQSDYLNGPPARPILSQRQTKISPIRAQAMCFG